MYRPPGLLLVFVLVAMAAGGRPGAATAQAEGRIFAPDTISDHRWQWRITFAPAGDTAYFAVSDEFFPTSRTATIVRSARGAVGTWSDPEVAAFSGTHSDMDPFITPAGDRLYFSSDRPVDGGPKEDFDIWYMERTAAGWGEPVHAGPGVNTGQDELYASETAAGTLYFGSGPVAPGRDGGWDIFRAERAGAAAFARREPVSAVNTRRTFDPEDPTADWEFNPEVSPDGRLLIFTTLRPGGYGLGDLYVSRRGDDGWGEPENLGPAVNTADDEFHPTLSPDGHTLYFARTVLTPEVVAGDFYSIPTEALGLDAAPRKR